MTSPDDNKPPPLTREQIEAALKRGARNANELKRMLDESHLRGLSRAMSLVLD